MFLAKPGYGPGKYGPCGGGESGDLQITDDALAFSVELTLRALDLRQDCVRPPRQQSTCGRESYPAAVWFDQPLAHIALQLGQLLRYRRGCQVQGRSGAGYRAKVDTAFRAWRRSSATFYGSYTVSPMGNYLCLTVRSAILDR